jgi:phospholipid/cholesterol/gamma-HCH transport system substrate-binding protein
MKEKRTELYVGIFLFVGLLLLGGIILRFGSFSEHFREKYPLIVYFPDTGGLVENSEVRLGGARIGRLARKPYLTPDATGIVAEVQIYDEFHIPEGSEFSIGVSGLLGDSYIAIKAPEASTGRFISANAEIKGVPATGLESLAASAGDLSRKGQEMLDGMRESLRDLNSALAKFDRSVLGEENLARFNGSIAQLNIAVTAINERVLDDQNTENLRLALSELRETSENLKKASRKLEPSLDSFRSVADQAHLTLEKTNVTLDEATEGSGLLAALLTDEQLTDDFRSLIRNLRENGVLRYKDAPETPPTSSDVDERRRGLFRKR